jgi:hypothetical protein
LPPAFGLFYWKIGKLDKKLTLPPETALLIREQVARINICLFCMAHSADRDGAPWLMIRKCADPFDDGWLAAF